MKFRTLLLGTAAAMAVSGAAQAADLAIAVEPIDYVKICDAFGVGYWYIPGTDTCLKIGGYVQLDVWFYDTDKVGDYFNIANQLDRLDHRRPTRATRWLRLRAWLRATSMPRTATRSRGR